MLNFLLLPKHNFKKWSFLNEIFLGTFTSLVWHYHLKLLIPPCENNCFNTTNETYSFAMCHVMHHIISTQTSELSTMYKNIVDIRKKKEKSIHCTIFVQIAEFKTIMFPRIFWVDGNVILFHVTYTSGTVKASSTQPNIYI